MTTPNTKEIIEILSSHKASTTPAKTTRPELVEVLTFSDLLPSTSSTRNNETLSPVITKSSLLPSYPMSMLSSPPTSESSFSSTTTVILTENPSDLIRIYDEIFPELQQYHDFVDRRLGPWKHLTEFKYF